MKIKSNIHLRDHYKIHVLPDEECIKRCIKYITVARHKSLLVGQSSITRS